MKHIDLFYIWTLVLSFTLLSLTLVTSENNEPPAVTLIEIEGMGERNAEFGFDLLKEISPSVGDKNVMVSPFITSLLLSMINLGTSGETKKELTKTLHYEDFERHVDVTFEDLLYSFFFNPDLNRNALKLANGIFSNDKFKIKTKFEEKLKFLYKSEVFKMDFTGNPRTAEDYMNEWVQNATNGKITDVVPRGSIGGSTAMMLISAIYMKTKWAEEFSEVPHESFHLTESETVDVEMMKYYSAPLKYANVEEHGFHLVEVPFKGKHAGMYFIVPHQVAGLDDVISSIDSDIILDVIDNRMKEVNVELRIPPFRFTNDLRLDPFLKNMGIRQLFTLNANLSNMLEDDLDNQDQGHCDAQGQECQNANGYHVDTIRQSSFIAVDRFGVEAAAAVTADILLGGEEPPPPDLTLVLNRPFSFFIRGRISRTVLFMGNVYNPLFH